MTGTTAHGYPYVDPTDYPKEFPASSAALANKLESGHFTRGKLNKTSDASGYIYITAAELGLTTVVGLIAGLHWGVDTNTYGFLVQARVNNPTQAQLRAWTTTAPLASKNIDFYFIAWGT